MTTKQQKYYLKNKETIIAKLKEKRKQIKTQTPNITITNIDESQSTTPTISLEVSTQTNLNFPDEKKYIDILRAMLIPLHKFVSIIPCEKDEKGRPIFFYINKYPDENSTEISILKIRYLKRGDGMLLYEPDWDIVEEISNIDDSNLHNIMAFDENKTYEGGSYLQWRYTYRIT
jgi:hypothetical protein